MSPVLKLTEQITNFATRRTEALIERFLPEFKIPAFFCGHKLSGSSDGPDLLYTLGHLHRLGVTGIAATPIEEAISKLLRGVDGPATETFFSYRVAETLLEFGPFADNPLLTGFTDAERDSIRCATDSSGIYDPETRQLRGLANNYWAVLARCELARQRLGIMEDDTLFNICISRLSQIILMNPAGFFDDDGDGKGRYDIYSADVHLFSEPLWQFLDPVRLRANLRQHVLLLEKMVMKNGASYVYGRSTGALSLCLTMELSALSLELGIAADPARSLGLIRHAFDEFQGWFEDDLINAHRIASTERYRGIHRLLQMTIDCLGKLCYAAEKLRNGPSLDGESEGVLFPMIDDFTAYDKRNAGLWVFRNEHVAFQLPVVDGWNADYTAWLRSPGLLESPVDSNFYCGAPRISVGPNEYTPAGLPARVEKKSAELMLTYEQLRCVGGAKPAEPLPGRYSVMWRVDGDTIYCEGRLSLEQVPDGISLFIPEMERPLYLEVASNRRFHQDTVAVSGLADWRSSWGEAKRVNQVHFSPGRELTFSLTLRPKLRVLLVPHSDDHDYTSALFKAMPKNRIVERRLCASDAMDAKAICRNIDILHVGWPEYVFRTEAEKLDERFFEFIEQLGRSGVRIVWTMHNRLPHYWDPERGRKLYCAWAHVVHGVIHHSKWGMDLMRRELPFRDDARHVVIPHGHYGEQMRVTRSRAEIEASLGLPPCAMRFGITGRWQKEKQVEMIVQAFELGARPDQQLVITAHKPDTAKSTDPRVIYLPRRDWMMRKEIAEHIHVCDVLVAAHTGDTYLTSGGTADAIGAGISMLVPRWEFFDDTLGDAPFYHDNTVASLAAAFGSITPADLERSKAAFRALQPEFAWPLLANKTLSLYRSLGA